MNFIKEEQQAVHCHEIGGATPAAPAAPAVRPAARNLDNCCETGDIVPFVTVLDKHMYILSTKLFVSNIC